jgi:hypothetical protein
LGHLMKPEDLDPEISARSIVALVLFREEPDEEEDEDNGKDDGDDDEGDDGYSE